MGFLIWSMLFAQYFITPNPAQYIQIPSRIATCSATHTTATHTTISHSGRKLLKRHNLPPPSQITVQGKEEKKIFQVACSDGRLLVSRLSTPSHCCPAPLPSIFAGPILYYPSFSASIYCRHESTYLIPEKTWAIFCCVDNWLGRETRRACVKALHEQTTYLPIKPTPGDDLIPPKHTHSPIPNLYFKCQGKNRYIYRHQKSTTWLEVLLWR